MEKKISVYKNDNLITKIIRFNTMATESIKSNGWTGMKAFVSRILIIYHSIKLFQLSHRQQEVLETSMYNVVRLSLRQFKLNKLGVAYLPSVPPDIITNQREEDFQEKLTKTLSKLDHNKMPKN